MAMKNSFLKCIKCETNIPTGHYQCPKCGSTLFQAYYIFSEDVRLNE